jgi:hypothetical protein
MRAIVLFMLFFTASLELAYGLHYDYFYGYNLSPASVDHIEEFKSFEKSVEELRSSGLPFNRLADSLLLTEDLLKAQLYIDINNGTPDYVLVDSKFEEIRQLKNLIFENYDELRVVKSFLSSLPREVRLNEEVIDIIDNAEEEFTAERFENSLALIDSAYEKVSELQAVETKIKAFYEATSRNIINFVKAIWKQVLTAMLILLVLFLLFFNSLMVFINKRKIKLLEDKKQVLELLTSKVQRDYFEKGILSEEEFHIKTKKFSELLRDVERQIPLLKEKISLHKKTLFPSLFYIKKDKEVKK